jgi:hypothetical protein
VAQYVVHGVSPVINSGEEDADGVQQRAEKSRVWPACSCSSWNGADVPLELHRAEVSFWCPWRR